MMIKYDLKIREFKKYYEANLMFYQSALNFFIGLFQKLPAIEHVSGRVKDFEECLSKFERKYLPSVEARNTNYRIFDYLTDFIGIRVVCLYLKDVPVIRKEIGKYFREIDITDKSIALEKSEDKFGYKSLHLDLKVKDSVLSASGFEKYRDVRFELQIRTLVQDAWSVLDHKIKYKRSIPQKLKRRINRLSALFELADEEFLRIREEIAFEEKRISQRIKQGDLVAKNQPLDVFRFLFVALRYFPNYNFVEFKVDGFVQTILDLKNDFNESDLNDAIKTNLNQVEKIGKKQRRVLNPYTKIRYCLYLYDQNVFSGILSMYQKNSISNINSRG